MTATTDTHELRALVQKWIDEDLATYENGDDVGLNSMMKRCRELRDLLARTEAGADGAAPFGWWMECNGTDADFGQFVTDRAFLEQMQAHGVVKAATPLYTATPTAAADSERLDWLESAGTLNVAHWYRAGMASFVELVDGDENKIAEGPTLRESIDAAMRKEAGDE